MVNILLVETRRPGTPPGRYFPNDCALLFRLSGRSYPNSLTFQSVSVSVEMRGFEPLASAVQRRRSPKLSYIPILFTG